MKKSQFTSITKWQKETFGEATAISKIIHLRKEIKELLADLKKKNPKRRLEFADCLILLFGSAKEDGMSYEDICDALDEKMKINRKRKWGKPDKDGVVLHIKKMGKK